MENARRAAFSFFPKRSGGCAPEAFVVAKQPSAALSVTPAVRLRHSEKLRCFYLDAARTRLEKTSAKILWNSLGTSNCLVFHILQNSMYVQQKKETHSGLKLILSE